MVGLGGAQRDLCAAQVELRGVARFHQLGGQPVGALLRGEGVARQAQQFLVGTQREVGAGHLGHQAHLRGDAGLVEGQVGRQRPVAEAADAAPQVQFPGGRHPGHVVAPEHVALPRGAEVGRYAL